MQEQLAADRARALERIAAAASVALRDRDRLAEDHDLARYLAAELAARQPDLVDPETADDDVIDAEYVDVDAEEQN